jgi:hypothetical protein
VTGANRLGHVANFVETEQVSSIEEDSAGKGREDRYDSNSSKILFCNFNWYSFVQVRGSVPVIWTQQIAKKFSGPVMKFDENPVNTVCIIFNSFKILRELHTVLLYSFRPRFRSSADFVRPWPLLGILTNSEICIRCSIV